METTTLLDSADDLIDYLKNHELDIYHSINDFGYLADVFLDAFGYPAGQAISDETKRQHAAGETGDPSIDNSTTGRFARHRDRIDKLEAFIEAVAGIYPNLDVVYQNIYKPPPRTFHGGCNYGN